MLYTFETLLRSIVADVAVVFTSIPAIVCDKVVLLPNHCTLLTTLPLIVYGAPALPTKIPLGALLLAAFCTTPSMLLLAMVMVPVPMAPASSMADMPVPTYDNMF